MCPCQKERAGGLRSKDLSCKDRVYLMQTAHSVKPGSQFPARPTGALYQVSGSLRLTLRNSQIASFTASRFSCGTASGMMTYPYSPRRYAARG